MTRSLIALLALSCSALSQVAVKVDGNGALIVPTAATFKSANGISGGTGTVTTVSVTTANGVSGTVANATTTPAISLSLGAITPTSVNGIVLSGAGGSTFTLSSGATFNAGSGATLTTLAGNVATSVNCNLVDLSVHTLNGVFISGSGSPSFVLGSGKTFTASNTLTIAGTDGSTLNVGGGGTLGTAAFTASTAYQPIDSDLTSWALITRAAGFDTFATTPSSSNLASLVTDETGSGALVFGTAPTITLANGTGLPISSGVSGLGTGVATFLATPSSANLASAITDETGSGKAVFATSPTITGPAHFSFSDNVGTDVADFKNTNTGASSFASTSWFNNSSNTVSIGIAGTGVAVGGNAEDGNFAFVNANTGSAGLNIAAAASSTGIQFFAGGGLAANLKMTIPASGAITVPAAITLSGAVLVPGSFVQTSDNTSGLGIVQAAGSTGNSTTRLLRSATTNFCSFEFGVGTPSSNAAKWAVGTLGTPTVGANDLAGYNHTVSRVQWTFKDSSGDLVLASTTASTSATTGSFTTGGGAGIAGDVFSGGNITTTTAGKTLAVKSGSNAKAGTFTLTAGSVTVSNTSVTANSVILVTLKTSGGTRIGNPDIVPTSGTGFVATGGAADTSVYNYAIIEVN